MSNLLAQIAQGWQGNPVGMYVQGQQQQRQNRLSDLQYRAEKMKFDALPDQNRLNSLLTQVKIAEAQRDLQDPNRGATFGKSVSAWGRDNEGKPVPLLVNDKGNLVVPETPEGVKGYMEPINYMDLGSYRQGFGGRSGLPVTPTIPKDIPPEQQPQNVADREEAKLKAQKEAEQTEQLQQKQKLYGAFEQAFDTYLAALDGTLTGPIAGRIPGVTTAAQIAEGGKAILKPLLKAMTKMPGEGTFTDRDAEDLFGQLPGREMHPQARGPVAAMLKQTLRRRFGIPDDFSSSPQIQPTEPGSPKAGTIEDGYRFIGGDPADPKRWVKVK